MFNFCVLHRTVPVFCISLIKVRPLSTCRKRENVFFSFPTFSCVVSSSFEFFLLTDISLFSVFFLHNSIFCSNLIANEKRHLQIEQKRIEEQRNEIAIDSTWNDRTANGSIFMNVMCVCVSSVVWYGPRLSHRFDSLLFPNLVYSYAVWMWINNNITFPSFPFKIQLSLAPEI